MRTHIRRCPLQPAWCIYRLVPSTSVHALGPEPTIRLCELRFGRREGRHGIGHKQECARPCICARRLDERVDIVGIGGERAIEKPARLRDMVWAHTLIEPSQTLKMKVHRVGIGRGLSAASLGGDELAVQRACQASDDFVLHVEEIG